MLLNEKYEVLGDRRLLLSERTIHFQSYKDLHCFPRPFPNTLTGGPVYLLNQQVTF